MCDAKMVVEEDQLVILDANLLTLSLLNARQLLGLEKPKMGFIVFVKQGLWSMKYHDCCFHL